jgi:hypothetical protein
MGGPQDRGVVPLLVALFVAAVTLKALVHGNYCLVPSTFLKPGEVGTVETSVYGILLYRGAGSDHTGMYREAVWWYKTALLAEWCAAGAAGAGAYLVVRWWRGPGSGSPARQPQTPNPALQHTGGA